MLGVHGMIASLACIFIQAIVSQERAHLPRRACRWSYWSSLAAALSPEDGGWVAVDLLEEVVDVRRRRNPVVDVEAEVAITPVQGPLPCRLGVAQPGDREPRPLRADALTPGRPALHDRQMPGPDVAFHRDLVANMPGDALPAPAPHPGHIQLRQTCLHHLESLSLMLLRMTGSATGGGDAGTRLAEGRSSLSALPAEVRR